MFNGPFNVKQAPRPWLEEPMRNKMQLSYQDVATLVNTSRHQILRLMKAAKDGPEAI